MFIITIIKFLITIIRCGLNKRNVLTLPINFGINFALITIWLVAFDKAKFIPNDIRPMIHNKLAFLMDNYLFGDVFNELDKQYNLKNYSIWTIFTSLCFCLVGCILLPSTIGYYYYKIKKNNVPIWEKSIELHEMDINIIEMNEFGQQQQQQQQQSNISNGYKKNLLKKFQFWFPLAIPLLAFIALNLMHLFSLQIEDNFNKYKDILAWISYVVLHIMVPILTAIYLYVFHIPGMVKCFAIVMGLQNIAGIITHLIIPTASPWFIHLYGINDTEHVNYQTEGFAAGLTRVDTHMGTHLNTNGFHKSPIVFGAVPSLHSAIAFQCFLFIMLRSTSLKYRFISKTTNNVPILSKNKVSLYEFDVESTSSSSTSSFYDDSFNQDLEMALLNKTPSSTPILAETITENNDNDVNKITDNANSNTIATSIDNNLRTTVGTNNQFIKLYDQDLEFSNKLFFKIFNRGFVPKILISSYIILQWWATMYLDHHFRFDLFVGMLYSVFFYSILNHYYIQPVVVKNWIDIRMGNKDDDWNEGRTMGMRVFKGKKFEWFFDPLA